MTEKQKKLLVQLVKEQIWDLEEEVKENPELALELKELKAILEELEA